MDKKTNYKVTTIKIREDLLNKTKALAALKGVHLGDYVSDLIEKGIEKETIII